jgi:hypothetical protein
MFFQQQTQLHKAAGGTVQAHVVVLRQDDNSLPTEDHELDLHQLRVESFTGVFRPDCTVNEVNLRFVRLISYPGYAAEAERGKFAKANPAIFAPERTL